MSLQPADGLVQQVIRVAIAENAPGHAHFVPVDPEFLRAIGEGERDFGEAERLAGIGAAENNVGHFAAAQRFGGLLAQHPADGIEHVGFAATVRADDGGDAFVKFESGFIGKRLEAEKFERFEMHARAASCVALRITSKPGAGKQIIRR